MTLTDTVPNPYEDLRQRVVDGDTTVTATQLDKARRDTDYADLQRQATEAAETRAADARLAAERESIVDAAHQLADAGYEAMQDHYMAALTALRRLRHAMVDYNGEVLRIDRAVGRLDIADLEVPNSFNIEFEVDRLEQLARHDHAPTAPFSRLYTGEVIE